MPPENEDLPPEFTLEEYNAALPAVLKRMTALGWIISPTSAKGVPGLRFTQNGDIARIMLRSFLIATGKGDNPGIEHAAFNMLIVNTAASQETN